MTMRTICAACGAIEPLDSMCVMSDDGEGPHDLVDAPTRLTQDDAEFLVRYAAHMDDGARER